MFKIIFVSLLLIGVVTADCDQGWTACWTNCCPPGWVIYFIRTLMIYYY